ncbi:MAG: c-type cytochrome [Burkholderiales bacterium]|nr:c-type cytochrome [Burkholderiales bacterium]
MNPVKFRGGRVPALFGALAVVAALSASAQAQPANANLGRNLAAQCANCHGTNGRSVTSVPSLAGQDAKDIVARMKEFRDGKVPKATIMHQLAKGYTDEQVALMAEFFSKQAE